MKVINVFYSLSGFFILFVLFVSSEINAQTNNNLNPIGPRFEGKPLVKLTYDYISGSDYEKKMKGKGLYEKGSLNDVQRIIVNTDIPLVKKQNFSLSALGEYRYSSTNYDKVKELDVSFPTLKYSAIHETHLFRGGIAFNYRTRLWKKPLLISATGIFDASEKYFENISGLYMATMVFRHTKNTTLALGMYVTTSSASQVPFFPIFSYRHYFEGTPYAIDIIFPKQTYVTRSVGDAGRLSVGFSVDNDRGYIYPRQEGFKRKYTYDRIDLLLEAKYEHVFFKNIVVGTSLAGSKCYQGVLRKKNHSKNVMKFSQDPNLFFKLSARYIIR